MSESVVLQWITIEGRGCRTFTSPPLTAPKQNTNFQEPVNFSKLSFPLFENHQETNVTKQRTCISCVKGMIEVIEGGVSEGVRCAIHADTATVAHQIVEVDERRRDAAVVWCRRRERVLQLEISQTRELYLLFYNCYHTDCFRFLVNPETGVV